MASVSQLHTEVFRADCVGFVLFIVLSLIVTADNHRKTKSDDQSKQRKGGGQNDVEIFVMIFLLQAQPPPQVRPNFCCQPQRSKRQKENQKWKVRDSSHGKRRQSPYFAAQKNTQSHTQSGLVLSMPRPPLIWHFLQCTGRPPLFISCP